MAREVKRLEVTAVDDELEKVRMIVRLENQETQQKEKPVRLIVEEPEIPVSQRLDLPERDIAELRTHQPGVGALIEGDKEGFDFTEQHWGAGAAANTSLPWGWFVLIGLALAGGVIWSLSRVKESEIEAEKIKAATEIVVSADEKEEREAVELIGKIENVIRDFYRTSSIGGRAHLVRHPDRVRPLMEDYYGGQGIPPSQQVDIKLLQPVTLDNRANFWMASVALGNGENPSLLIEILESGEARIDWETLVCHQPMPWQSFVENRPSGTSLDFRVYVEPDNFFSHEFANSSQWTCYRLSALDSDPPLFGYVPAGSEVAATIEGILQQNASRRASMILRLSIPTGLQSRSGVMIEKVLSPRWIYVESPGSDL